MRGSCQPDTSTVCINSIQAQILDSRGWKLGPLNLGRKLKNRKRLRVYFIAGSWIADRNAQHGFIWPEESINDGSTDAPDRAWSRSK